MDAASDEYATGIGRWQLQGILLSDKRWTCSGIRQKEQSYWIHEYLIGFHGQEIWKPSTDTKGDRKHVIITLWIGKHNCIQIFNIFDSWHVFLLYKFHDANKLASQIS